jgi:hypothetical protein
MKKLLFIPLCITYLFTYSSCSQNPDPWIDDEENKDELVHIGIKFNSFNAEDPSSPPEEANWTHIVSFFKNNVDESMICSAYKKASNAEGIDSFLLAPANYTLTSFAISDIDAVNISPISILSDCLPSSKITINPDKQTPEIVCSKKNIDVTEREIAQIEFTRIVGQLAIQLTGVPASPAVDSIVVSIPQLYDTFSFDGKYGTSSKSNRSKSIILKMNPDKVIFSNIYDNKGNLTNGTVIMPSNSEKKTIDLHMTLYYKNKTTRKLTTNTDAVIKPNTQLKINAKLSNTPAQIITHFTYAPWCIDKNPIEVTFPFDNIDDEIDIDPNAPIGTLIKNGIVFSPGKLVSIDIPSDTLDWIDANYWTAGRGKSWRIPTVNEWKEIEKVLEKLNTSLDTISKSTPFINGHRYWTSSTPEEEPDGKFVHIIKNKPGHYWGKTNKRFKVRAIYVVDPS